ncbi:MAG: hypothetical protein V1810_00355 [Candidatus Beckwithbacteria bacterium]
MPTVEQQGQEWGKIYFEAKGGDLSQTVLIINQEHLGILELPSITERKLGVRIDPWGNIITLEWKNKPIGEINGRRTIKIPRDVEYCLIHPDPEQATVNYLTDIPGRRSNVRLLIPMTSVTIETAIRLQQHVIESGRETATQAAEVVNFCNGAVGALLNDRISWEVLEQQTDGFLLKIGLIKPQVIDKIKIGEMLRKIHDKDSLGRENQLVSRTRIRSAYLAAVRQKVFSGLVEDKYADNKIQLEYEREFNRWALAEARDLLELKLQVHAGFKKQGEENWPQRKLLETVIVEEIAHGLLIIPRVKPYLAAARLSGIALVGCRPECVEINRQIIGNQIDWQWLINQDSVVQMVAGNRFTEADERVGQIKSMIDNVLQ